MRLCCSFSEQIALEKALRECHTLATLAPRFLSLSSLARPRKAALAASRCCRVHCYTPSLTFMSSMLAPSSQSTKVA